MAWLRPTVEHLKLVLAQDEIEKLENASSDLSGRIQGQLDATADLYRSAYMQKGYTVDVRDHYIDSGYLIPMLNYARYQIWTTFPMTEDYALSKPREELYKAAQELLKNPYLGTSTPDYSDDPDLSAKTLSSNDKAIAMPFQRFPSLPWENGFYAPYMTAIDKLFGGR